MDADGDWIKVSFGDHQVLMARQTFEFYEPKSLILECRESGVMSSHKVSDSDTSTVQHRTTIRDLPDEMVSNIFKYLGTNDLLRRCRLVCKSWKNISTELCRQRFVQLKSYFEKDGEREGDNIFTLFDIENLPWSSYWFPRNSSYPTRSHEFLRFFGKQIWDLTFYDADKGDCKRILCHTPNVRQITIHWKDREDADCTPQLSSSSTEGLDLSRLKRLTYENEYEVEGDSDGEFLKYIIATGKAKLNYFKCLLRMNSSEAVGMVASLLANVPSIFCDINYTPSKPNDFKELLTNYQNLRITELILYLDKFDGEGVNEYPLINLQLPEQFIATHSDHLEMLEVNFEDFYSIPFNFPSLPALTSLSIIIKRETRSTETRFLSLLQSDNFPVLDEVKFQVDNWTSARDDNFHLYLPDNCCFEFVSKLSIETYWNVRGDLRRGFPNLKSLIFRFILDPETLLECFSWTTLEDLTLEFLVGMDVNALLSGIPNPYATYEKSEKEIAQERERHGRPSILQLTRLKNLDITFESEDEESKEILRDAGAYLSLLQLQPLNLTLGGAVKLSVECIGKLDAHHRNFRIKD